MKPRKRALHRQRNGWQQSSNNRHSTPSNNVIAFTLIDEARQTSSHDTSFWSQNTQLRKKPVAFVSSGSHDPLTSPPIKEEETEDSTKSTETPAAADEAQLQPDPKQLRPDARQPEPDTCSSSDEVIVFKGRNHMKPKIQAPEITQPAPKTLQIPEVTRTSEETQVSKTTQIEEAQTPEAKHIPEASNNFKSTHAQEITLTSIQTEIQAVERELSSEPRETRIQDNEASKEEIRDEDEEGSDGLFWPKKKSNKSRRRPKWGEDSEEDAILADYIANMRQNGEMMGETSEEDSESSSTDDAGDHLSAPPGLKDEGNVDIYSEADYQRQKSLFNELDDDLDKRESHSISRPSSQEKLKGKTAIKGPTGTFMHSFTEAEHPEEPGDFDFMDWERPSVRRKKGRARRLLLGSDIDSDLEDRLQAAYNNDRQRKAERKREREELRATGMLGKRSQPDLLAKYRTGITASEAVDEIKTFLAGPQQILNLPPMDKRTRILVHELANKFSIKSKSVGAENQRRPILTKTKKTSYREDAFDRAVSRVRWQHFAQPGGGGGGRSRNKPQPSSGRHNLASYQDGEIIGASAPELGTGNRGRTMLEKMGWSTGTPLGTSDNQGILHPVSQTMKRTRAGLGQ
ncbi:hypothetical protein ACQKWADRAFT_290104 [Trichoderma austrokoningii]